MVDTCTTCMGSPTAGLSRTYNDKHKQTKNEKHADKAHAQFHSAQVTRFAIAGAQRRQRTLIWPILIMFAHPITIVLSEAQKRLQRYKSGRHEPGGLCVKKHIQRQTQRVSFSYCNKIPHGRERAANAPFDACDGLLAFHVINLHSYSMNSMSKRVNVCVRLSHAP